MFNTNTLSVDEVYKAAYAAIENCKNLAVAQFKAAEDAAIEAIKAFGHAIKHDISHVVDDIANMATMPKEARSAAAERALKRLNAVAVEEGIRLIQTQ